MSHETLAIRLAIAAPGSHDEAENIFNFESQLVREGLRFGFISEYITFRYACDGSHVATLPLATIVTTQEAIQFTIMTMALLCKYGLSGVVVTVDHIPMEA